MCSLNVVAEANNFGLDHFADQVIAFTRTFADAAEN